MHALRLRSKEFFGRTLQRRRPARDDVEAALFKGLGHVVTITHERYGLDRDELASKCEMTRSELEKIERGELDEWWGGLRRLAKALDMSPQVLMSEAEEFTPGPNGEKLRQITREEEMEHVIRERERSDAAKRRKPS